MDELVGVTVTSVTNQTADDINRCDQTDTKAHLFFMVVYTLVFVVSVKYSDYSHIPSSSSVCQSAHMSISVSSPGGFGPQQSHPEGLLLLSSAAGVQHHDGLPEKPGSL